jgi:hypothetical protein
MNVLHRHTYLGSEVSALSALLTSLCSSVVITGDLNVAGRFLNSTTMVMVWTLAFSRSESGWE